VTVTSIGSTTIRAKAIQASKREPWQYGISHLMWLVLGAAVILGFGTIIFQVLRPLTRKELETLVNELNG